MKPEIVLLKAIYEPTMAVLERDFRVHKPYAEANPLAYLQQNCARVRAAISTTTTEVNRGHFGCYAPPFTTEKWLNRFAFMEKAGDRWWPYLGAIYVVQAIKRVKGMHLIGPAWKRSDAPSARGVPATNRKLN